MLVLNQQEVEELLDMPGCIDAMEVALAALARGEMDMPLRSVFIPDGAASLIGLMPAYRGGEGAAWSLKSVVVVPENPRRGLDAHQGTVTLFDGETGEVRALMNASAVTAIRTAAVSGVATRLLAREDVATLGILGAGVQARSHAEAMRAVREFDHVLLWSPTPEHARACAEEVGADVADSAREVVEAAEVLVAATNSTEPVLERAWLRPGTHVNSAGGRPPQMMELDTATIADSAFFVDRRESTENEAADYKRALAEGAIEPGHIRAEIGEIAAGLHEGRRSDDEITVFRSMGLAVEDLAAADYVVRKAQEAGVGTTVEL